MVKIAVLASFNMDLVMRTERRPNAGETLQGDFAMHLGGKGFNQAVAARRLGAEVFVAGRVGDDEFGRLFLDTLDREGIDRRAVITDPIAGTGVASIIVEPDGTNTIIQSPRANRNVTRKDVEDSAAILGDVDGALLQLETSMDAAGAFASWARNRRIRTVLNPSPIVQFPPALLQLTDVLVANEFEARAILASDDHDVISIAERVRDRHRLATVVVTLGGDGAVAADDLHRLEVRAFDVPVVDTTGAGDAFCAALAVRLAEKGDLAEALRFANAAGALACTRVGAEPSMPRRDEVEELLARGATR